MQGLLVALSNPKVLLFLGAFLPQFIQPSMPQGVQFLWLGVIFVVIDTLVMVAYAQAGARLVNILSLSALRLLNRACAAGILEEFVEYVVEGPVEDPGDLRDRLGGDPGAQLGGHGHEVVPGWTGTLPQI